MTFKPNTAAGTATSLRDASTALVNAIGGVEDAKNGGWQWLRPS